MKPAKPKINPGKGWRLLKGSELVRPDCYFTSDGKKWIKTGYKYEVPTAKYAIAESDGIIAYRTKIKSKVKK